MRLAPHVQVTTRHRRAGAWAAVDSVVTMSVTGSAPPSGRRRTTRGPPSRCAGCGSGSATRSRSPAWTSTCRPAPSSASSAPTAPARPPPCRWPPGCCGPTPATVRVHGQSLWADPTAAKRMLGVLPDGVRLFDRLTGAQLITYAGLLRGMDRDTVAERTADLLRALDLGGGRRHARRRLLRRHDEEGRAGLRAHPCAAAPGAGRAVRGGRPGLRGEHPRHPARLRRHRRHGHRVVARHGPRPAHVRPRRGGGRRPGARRRHGRRRARRARRSRSGSSSSSAAAARGRGSRGCAPPEAQADAAAQRPAAQPVAARRPGVRGPLRAGPADGRDRRARRAAVRRRSPTPRSSSRSPARRCVLGWWLVPLVATGVDSTLDPQRFVTYAVPQRQLLTGLALAGVVGVPGLVTALLRLGTVVPWSRGPATVARGARRRGARTGGVRRRARAPGRRRSPGWSAPAASGRARRWSWSSRSCSSGRSSAASSR